MADYLIGLNRIFEYLRNCRFFLFAFLILWYNKG